MNITVTDKRCRSQRSVISADEIPNGTVFTGRIPECSDGRTESLCSTVSWLLFLTVENYQPVSIEITITGNVEP
jgi:hypothetical protein